MPPRYRKKLEPRNFEVRAGRDYSGPPGQPSSGLHIGYGGGQRPAVSYSSEWGGPSDEYLKSPMGRLPSYRAKPSYDVGPPRAEPYRPDFTKEPTQPWNLISQDNRGVMGSRNGESWLAKNPWLVELLVRRHGDPSDLGALEGLDNSGGNGWLGADWDVDVGRGENDSWNLGLTAEWNTPKWLGG